MDSSSASDDPQELFQAASTGDEEVVSSLNPTKEMMDGGEFEVTDHRSLYITGPLFQWMMLSCCSDSLIEWPPLG